MYSWNTLIRIILCIAICIALLLLFKWGKKKIDEGFQTSSEYTTLGDGTYHGTNGRLSATSNANEIDTNVILFRLNTPLSIQFKFIFFKE